MNLRKPGAWCGTPRLPFYGRFGTNGAILGGSLFLLAMAMAARASAGVIASCGFEPAGDTWSFSFVGGTLNADPGSDDSPADQRVLGGSQSWLVKGTTSTLSFAEVWLSGWTNVVVRYRVSSTANGGQGNQLMDSVAAWVATTTYADQNSPVFGGTADVTLTGYGVGATWGYNSGATAQIEPLGGGKVLRPSGGGLRTADGFTDIGIGAIPQGSRSLALQICATNDSPAKCWNLDNVVLEGTPTSSNDRWWDGDGEGAVGGGSGVWDNTAATPWAADLAGGGHFKWKSGNGDNARFGQSGGTVTIPQGTTIAVRSLTFTADGYTIVAAGDDIASRLVLTSGGGGGAGPNTIDVDSGHTATINVTITGNPGVGLTKAGEGTLVLGHANGYRGTTAINAGVLSISAANNLGAVGSAVSFNGGTLRLTASADFKGSHPCDFLASGGTIDTGNNTLTALTTGWSGGGALAKTGAGTLRLDGIGDGFSGAVALHEGTLRLGSNQTLANCPLIDVGLAATLDVSSVPGGYSLGTSGNQVLKGRGTIVGNLMIAGYGVHNVGDSLGVQRVQGDYVMNGLLEIEIGGALPGDTGEYDQVCLVGPGENDVTLGGDLSLAWSGAGWSSAADRLWIIHNDTDGTLTGAFRGYADGAVVGDYDGQSWRIWYGVDLDETTGLLIAGNDVLLTPATLVPEPSSLGLGVCGLLALLWVFGGRRVQRRRGTGKEYSPHFSPPTSAVAGGSSEGVLPTACTPGGG